MTTALLIIDLQQGMFTSGPTPHDDEAVLSRVAGLIERARAEGVPVLHVRHDGGADDPLARGTPGFEIHPKVAPATGEPVFEKTECNAFHRTGLHDALRRSGLAHPLSDSADALPRGRSDDLERAVAAVRHLLVSGRAAPP